MSVLSFELTHSIEGMEKQQLSPSPGRRERSKRQKLERITAAASALFAQRGVDDVTTQQIADAADIAAGTLFLYVKSKSELLLLVQNLSYADAAKRGQLAAETTLGTLDAVIAHIRPVVECNRAQVENGRTYLREMMFGDANEPHHAEAIRIALESERAIAATLRASPRITTVRAGHLARAITAILYLTLSDGSNVSETNDQLIQSIRDQVGALL